MKRRTLYLPIETKCRELLGKTLLAARAVDRGWRVFLGGIGMHEYIADGLPPGLVIENNIPDTKATRLAGLRNHGYRSCGPVRGKHHISGRRGLLRTKSRTSVAGSYGRYPRDRRQGRTGHPHPSRSVGGETGRYRKPAIRYVDAACPCGVRR